MFHGKKILILAGAEVHCKVVRAAKEMGLYTIVTDYLEDSPAKKIADESWMCSITDVDAIVAKCREAKVDAVINLCNDLAQKPYCEICNRLGLPCYATMEQFKIMTEKKCFKAFCREHGVDVIDDYSYEDLVNNRVSYPVFIKPAESRGSRGQFICRNKDEALSAFASAKSQSLDGEALCEQYVEGKQDTASAFFVVDGEPYLLKFGDRIMGKKSDGLSRQVMCTVLPSMHASQYEAHSMAKVKKLIHTLGIEFGPVFLQGFVDDQTIRYYDPALRMPGSDYVLMLKNATGVDVVKSMIHFAVSGDTKTFFGNPVNAYRLNDKVGLLITISVRPGKIAKIEGVDELANNKRIICAQQLLPEGAEVPATGDIKQRVAEVNLITKSKAEAREALRFVYQTIRVLDDAGEDMIVSRVDPSLI